MADGVISPAAPPLAAGYIERVRFAWERELREEVRRVDDGRAGSTKEVTSGVLIPLTPSLAPRPHRLAREVAATLGLTAPFELFQTRDFVEINAQAFAARTTPAVRLVGPVVNLLNDAELRVMLGHEIGHILAHGIDSAGVGLDVVERFRPRARLLAARCSVATEVTADRFGLLAARDLDAIVGVEIANETGLDPRALEADLAAHLDACLDRVRRGEGPIANESHPTRDFRLFAAWLFWQTDVFRDLTGKGTGARSLVDVDAELKQRLQGANLLERVAPAAVVTKNVFAPAAGLKSETSVEGFVLAEGVASAGPSPWAARAGESWGEAKADVNVRGPEEPVAPQWAARASEAWADVAAKVRDAITQPSSPPRASREDDLLPVEVPVLDDDLERRFLALERAAAKVAEPTVASAASVSDDLEARFLALEARFAK